MNLYHVMGEGCDDYVEADSFGDAIKKWRLAKLSEFGDVDEAGRATGWSLESEPESVYCLSEQPVIR